jgi:glycosyltransferase involved in cell wall biosynthesis
MALNNSNPLYKYFLHRESRILAQYEIETCNQFDNVIWVTEEDYQSISKLFNKIGYSVLERTGENHIIPICIDPDEYRLIYPVVNDPNVIFIGGMHWPPNNEGVIWFINNVYPILMDKYPELKIFFIGKNPPENLLNLKNVHFPGYVLDLESFWEISRVFIVPLLSGGGMRVKILEAWAKGIPVVSTSIGAEGIRYTKDKDIIIADKPQEFADGIFSVLDNQELTQRLSISGRETVEIYYDWNKTYHKWDEVYF